MKLINLFALSLALLVGCMQGEAPPVPVVAVHGAARADDSGSAPAGTATSDQRTGAAHEQDTWDSIYMNDEKVGYTHTTITPVEEEGAKRLKVRNETKMTLVRFGQPTTMRMVFTSLETSDGDLLRFETVVENSPGSASGEVQGNQLVLRTTDFSGRPRQYKIDWPDDVKGFSAESLALKRHPLEPGDRRSFKALVPIVNQVGTISLAAEDYEHVELLGGRAERLLRVTSSNSLLPGVKTVMWVDDEGEALKTYTAVPLPTTTYRTTREEALAPADSRRTADFGLDTLVKVARPIPNAHATREVLYRITVEGSDPSELFLAGPRQTVKKVGPNAIELRVTATRPEADGRQTAEVADEYRKPNGLIESDDPKIIELAREAAGDADDTWDVGTRLESWVAENLVDKNFSTGFASAAEVAANLEGDCTEHAVLLAAMARARGIPARVAMGLVYMQRSQTFGYHMWSEVFVDGQWHALDGTLGRGGIGAAHIKMMDSSLAGVSVVETFLPIIKVLGRTKIEVLDVR